MSNESVSFVIDKVLPRKWRAIVYPLSATIIAVLYVIGKITADQAGQWLETIAIVLGFGGTTLAAINRPREVVEEKEF